MQKKFKHVTLGWIAFKTHDKDTIYEVQENDKYKMVIPKELIENSSDWVEVKEKEYPSEYSLKKGIIKSLVHNFLSPKYVNKLSTLDTLLCIRDEYNEIDGYKQFDINNKENKFSVFYIVTHEKLSIFEAYETELTFSFKTKEVANIFMKNFETQLLEVKEFING